MAVLRPSILRNVLLAFLAYGLAIGGAFPIITRYFMEWDAALYPWFFAACLACGAISAALYYALLKWLLLNKLERISEVANAISQKDISHVCTMKSEDMIGEIIESFNQMAQTLRNTITLIDEVSQELSTSASHVSQVTTTTSQSAGNQQQQTAQVAASMSDMVNTVQDVAQNTTQAAEAATSAAEEARAGALLATEAITSIDRLNHEIKNAVGVIDNVKAENSNIHSVLDVIRDITEQTNLLALNAAIEAARAGEQGRGFAVVADEVRTLAKRTQESTLEIHDMIERLNQQVEAAVAVMGEASAQAMHSEGKVEDAAISLSEIAGSVKSISDMNTQAAYAAGQQTAVVEEINHSVLQISEAGETGAQAMQTAARATGNLQDISERLRSLVGQFRL